MPKRTHALVETPHHGDDDGELDLQRGDVVTVLLKRDSHWWIGKSKGKKGLFPANNVKEIKGMYSGTHVIVVIKSKNTSSIHVSLILWTRCSNLPGTSSRLTPCTLVTRHPISTRQLPPCSCSAEMKSHSIVPICCMPMFRVEYDTQG